MSESQRRGKNENKKQRSGLCPQNKDGERVFFFFFIIGLFLRVPDSLAERRRRGGQSAQRAHAHRHTTDRLQEDVRRVGDVGSLINHQRLITVATPNKTHKRLTHSPAACDANEHQRKLPPPSPVVVRVCVCRRVLHKTRLTRVRRRECVCVSTVQTTMESPARREGPQNPAELLPHSLLSYLWGPGYFSVSESRKPERVGARRLLSFRENR